MHGARGRVSLDLRACIHAGFGTELVLVLVHVLVVSKVTGGSQRFMSAIRRYSRPAELERQKHEQNDGEKATHGQESSDNTVRAMLTKSPRMRSVSISGALQGAHHSHRQAMARMCNAAERPNWTPICDATPRSAA